MKAFWDKIGHGLAAIAKGAAYGAIWASKNPTVIASVASIAGHPNIGVIITQIDGVVAATIPTQPVK